MKKVLAQLLQLLILLLLLVWTNIRNDIIVCVIIEWPNDY